jgi:hypothetical protein
MFFGKNLPTPDDACRANHLSARVSEFPVSGSPPFMAMADSRVAAPKRIF